MLVLLDLYGFLSSASSKDWSRVFMQLAPLLAFRQYRLGKGCLNKDTGLEQEDDQGDLSISFIPLKATAICENFYYSDISGFLLRPSLGRITHLSHQKWKIKEEMQTLRQRCRTLFLILHQGSITLTGNVIE